MHVLLLPSELELLIDVLERGVSSSLLLGMFRAELDRDTYSSREAALVLGCSVRQVRNRFPAGGRKVLVISRPVLFRAALLRLTMASSPEGKVRVPDGCVARLVNLGREDVRFLNEAIRTSGWSAGGRLSYLGDFFARLDGDDVVSLTDVAAHYGRVVDGAPWPLSWKGNPLTRKVDWGVLYVPNGRRGRRLRSVEVRKAEVLALGRNTWVVSQTDDQAEPPPWRAFAPW